MTALSVPEGIALHIALRIPSGIPKGTALSRASHRASHPVGDPAGDPEGGVPEGIAGRPRFHLVSLGCAKNTVDSESMATLLARDGFQATTEAAKADVLIVNTCGFIAPARDESMRHLRQLAADKKSGQLLIAAGCLTQRYGAEVARQVPGVDGLLGTRRWMDIVELVHRLRRGQAPALRYDLPPAPTVGRDERGVLRAAVQGASAYLKIADGCRRPCTFCAIPAIKGTAVSRPLPTLVDEVRQLEQLGVREVILIAQDTTDYGHDLGMRHGLAALLEALLSAAPAIDWFRVLYAYPGAVTERLIDVMASEPRLLAYLDMPLQHAHPAVLRRMRRPANMTSVVRTLQRLRHARPGMALRTTFIVGFPGETEDEFETLMDFVDEMRFDRVGVFPFSFEPGTASEPLGDPVPAEVKEDRRRRLMEKQQQISLEANQAQVGRVLPVLIEGIDGALSIGRSYRDAPEIDGLVIVEGEIPPGELAPVRITGAMAYDLTGVVEVSPEPVIIRSAITVT
ncbi:MAG TPA: 30S ribosomal protein S12 methylthiotransferase RimO [Anaerolineales bacterium]|nr:30S ribosomal protein S12 methylthiotransferase RimO [Anaerolineales bacterium]